MTTETTNKDPKTLPLRRFMRSLPYVMMVGGLGFYCATYVEFGGWTPPPKSELKTVEAEVVEAHVTSRSTFSGFRDLARGNQYVCYIGRCGNLRGTEWYGKHLTLLVARDRVFQISDGTKVLKSYDELVWHTNEKKYRSLLFVIVGVLFELAYRIKTKFDTKEN